MGRVSSSGGSQREYGLQITYARGVSSIIYSRTSGKLEEAYSTTILTRGMESSDSEPWNQRSMDETKIRKSRLSVIRIYCKSVFATSFSAKAASARSLNVIGVLYNNGEERSFFIKRITDLSSPTRFFPRVYRHETMESFDPEQISLRRLVSIHFSFSLSLFPSLGLRTDEL